MADTREMVNMSILGALFVFGLLALAVPANAIEENAATSIKVDSQLNTAYEEDRIMVELDAQESLDADVTSDASINSQISLLRNDTKQYRLPNESSYTLVSTGNGWVTANESGRFVKIVLVERAFVNSTDNNEIEVRAGRGLIKLSEDRIYRLRSHSYGNGTVTYDVIDERGNAQGTLILIERTSFSAFSVWSGSIELDTGQSYDLEIATMSKRNISPDDLSTGYENETQKMNAWARLRAFLRLN